MPESQQRPGLAPIEAAIAAIARGEMVVVVDDADRENEGDLVMAAEKVTPGGDRLHGPPHGRGLICVPMLRERARRARLAPMVARQHRPARHRVQRHGRRRRGTSTGISAADRAATIRALADPATAAARPRAARPRLPAARPRRRRARRAGHTEAAVDLPAWPGSRPAGVICEIVADDGAHGPAARPAGLRREHGLPIVTIADLIALPARQREARRARERGARCRPSTATSRAIGYRDVLDGVEHLALVLGDVAAPRGVARARALRVPDRRRLRLAALRLRRPARARAGA